MRYFSGFCFKGELHLFDDLFCDFNISLNEFDIVGFSYGAQRAIEYARSIFKTKRIGRIFLLSPAFFQQKNESFVSMQLQLFNKNKDKYIISFLKRCGLNLLLESIDNKGLESYQEVIEKFDFLDICSSQDLENLLRYEFKNLDFLENIEVFTFIGGSDLIVDSKESFNFFSKYTISFLLNDYNHILKNKGF